MKEEITIPTIPKHIIKVPKEIIGQNQLPEHRISILVYLNYNQTWEGRCQYSPIHMITWCGYKPKWDRSANKNNIYVKFKCSMKWLLENNYIDVFDEKFYIQNTLQSSYLLEKLYPNDNFGILYDFEIDAIMSYQSSYKPLNKSILLLLLSYIRSFTWYRKNEITGHSEKSKKSKPEVCITTFTKMESFLGIERHMISKATDVLEELGLIKTHRMPNFQDADGNWNTGEIIYTCPYKIISTKQKLRICTKDEYDYQKELINAIEFLRNDTYKSKKFYQN